MLLDDLFVVVVENEKERISTHEEDD